MKRNLLRNLVCCLFALSACDHDDHDHDHDHETEVMTTVTLAFTPKAEEIR